MLFKLHNFIQSSTFLSHSTYQIDRSLKVLESKKSLLPIILANYKYSRQKIMKFIILLLSYLSTFLILQGKNYTYFIWQIIAFTKNIANSFFSPFHLIHNQNLWAWFDHFHIANEKNNCFSILSVSTNFLIISGQTFSQESSYHVKECQFVFRV